MAFIRDEEEEKKQQQGLAAPAVGGTPAEAPGGAPAAAAPQQKSGHINLSQYLEANRPQAQAMAGKLAGDVEAQAQKAQTGLGDVQKAGAQAVQSSTQHFTPPYAQAQPAAAAPAQAASSYQPRALATPWAQPAAAPVRTLATPWTQTPIAAPVAPAGWAPGGEAQAKTVAASRYEGPLSLTGVQGYATALGDTQKAQSQLGALGSQSGREALLGETYGKGAGGYSPGQSRLDSFLAGAAGGGRFNELQAKYGNLGQNLDAATANTAPYRAAQEASSGARQRAQEYLDTGGRYQNDMANYNTQVKDAAEKKAREADAQARENFRRGVGPALADNEEMYQAWLRGDGGPLSKLTRGGR